MKILLVITGLGVGGAERLVTGLADHYVATGHEVVLASLHGEAALFPNDKRVRMVNLQVRRSPLGFVAALRRLRMLILEFRPDVVNSHLVHANILARLVRLLTSMPRLVSSAHNTNEGGQLRMLAYRLTDRLADISTNVSAEAVKAFEDQHALRHGRMIGVYNGIDTQKFVFNSGDRKNLRRALGIADETPLLLAVGRLGEQKDYPNLIKAFAELGKNLPCPYLFIAGEGALHDELVMLAESLGVADRVSFLGVRHDVPALMCACDVLVLSSAWEGFGLVVAEAMACERVVVATDCGGVKEVVGDEGYLVAPRDSGALALALGQALSLSLEETQRLGCFARQRVIERFSLAATADCYLTVYGGRAAPTCPEASH